MTPLNGTKTHPLTPLGLAALRRLVEHPIPKWQMNPGQVNRLLREKLAEVVTLPIKFKHGVRTIPCVQITDAGREAIK